MPNIALPLLVSFAICLALVMTTRWHGRFTLDHPVGVQKVHTVPVPRVGGIGIYLGLLTFEVAAPFGSQDTLHFILLAGVPALAIGLMEDMTKRVRVAVRLLATMISGLMICLITGVSLTAVGLPGLDSLLAIPLISVAFTLVAVAGLANAVNILDGFNGLASGSIAIASAAIGAVAWSVGDLDLAYAALALTLAVLGFLLVNFPWGKIFMGDGGAYFAGFALAWLAVLLPERNAGISPWVSLLACAYPVFETVYSMARRLLSRQAMTQPDAMHLHGLVKTQLVRRHLSHWPRWARHAAVAPPLWLLAALPAGLAWGLSGRSTALLLLVFAGFAVLYHLIYQRLARLAQAEPIADTTPAALQQERPAVEPRLPGSTAQP